jgi:Tfp pilus assembly protein PilN
MPIVLFAYALVAIGVILGWVVRDITYPRSKLNYPKSRSIDRLSEELRTAEVMELSRYLRKQHEELRAQFEMNRKQYVESLESLRCLVSEAHQITTEELVTKHSRGNGG